MNIKLSKGLALALGADFLAGYGVDPDRWRWHDAVELNLAHYSPYKNLQLKNRVAEFPSHKGAKSVLKDIGIWLSAAKSPERATARNANTAFSLLQKYLLGVPGQRIYRKDDVSDVWYCYYVHKLSYTPPRTHRDWPSPGYVTLYAVYQEFGERRELTNNWHDGRCAGKTPEALLSSAGYYPENEEMRAQYVAGLDKYVAWHDQIGKQFYAVGEASDDLDGNPHADRDSSYWWRKKINSVRMERYGEPARVVIDVFSEEESKSERDREHKVKIDNLWWRKIAAAQVPDEEGDIESDTEVLAEKAEEGHEAFIPEVPIHPLVACFDLRRHLRIKLHVDQLTEYVYDPQMADRLVLPSETRELVDILLAHKSAFADVVAGKGGGSVILCTGGPGLGKTLTSEIYAEVAARPLYTIQCSQLGTDPDDLENELLKAFMRAERWGAILQLDEADVYIRTRGDDLVQNAIVGVFLRVMEYYRGVMFMTTNRPEMVDDAIASRCVARLNYDLPTREEQARIWRIQASLNGATLAPKELEAIVKAHSDCTGRDIKNLMKLALLYAEAKQQNAIVTAKTIHFVKRFKPTLDGATPRAD